VNDFGSADSRRKRFYDRKTNLVGIRNGFRSGREPAGSGIHWKLPLPWSGDRDKL